MQITSLSSLATAAFDTARTTIKAMAEAAVPPADAEARAAAPAPAAPAAPAAATEDENTGQAAATEPVPAKGRRLGTVLDAYA
jgi:hypothetical protein